MERNWCRYLHCLELDKSPWNSFKENEQDGPSHLKIFPGKCGPSEWSWLALKMNMPDRNGEKS